MVKEYLRHAVTFMLRDEAFLDGDHTEWFQFSKGFFCEFDRKKHAVISLKMNGKEVGDDDVFTAAMQNHFFQSMESNFDLTLEEIGKNGKPMEIATNGPDVLEEYLNDHGKLKLDGEKRLVIHEA